MVIAGNGKLVASGLGADLDAAALGDGPCKKDRALGARMEMTIAVATTIIKTATTAPRQPLAR